MKGRDKMTIRCGCCHEVLKDDELLVMDFINTLTHLDCSNLYDVCLGLNANLIKDIATYEAIKQKYWYYRMELVH